MHTDILQQIADNLLDWMRENKSIERDTVFEDYHGFQIGNLSDDFVNQELQPFHLTLDDVEVDFVKVSSDLKDQIHFHEGSAAYVYVLGFAEGFQEASGAIVYKNGTWVEVKSGESWLIEPYSVHGFSVEPGGILYFLSVQSPPIVQGTKDDYHKVA